jgi:hypothetical protein
VLDPLLESTLSLVEQVVEVLMGQNLEVSFGETTFSLLVRRVSPMAWIWEGRLLQIDLRPNDSIGESGVNAIALYEITGREGQGGDLILVSLL